MIQNNISDFLNIVLIETDFFFFNLWSIVHFISGGIVIYYLIKKFKVKKPFVYLFGILLAYELFEIYVISTGSNLFIVETNLDQLYDIIFGMVGGLFVKNKIKKGRLF